MGAPPSFVNVKNAAAGGVLVGAAAADVVSPHKLPLSLHNIKFMD